MSDERGELAMRPMTPPWYSLISGPHWLITIGDPPLILAACTDVDVAERIVDLLVEHHLIEPLALIVHSEGEPRDPDR